VADISVALASYTELFGNLFYVGLTFAALLLLVSPLLKKMMHGIR
jgi:POT family proton-dependent oligopeptide transporter